MYIRLPINKHSVTSKDFTKAFSSLEHKVKVPKLPDDPGRHIASSSHQCITRTSSVISLLSIIGFIQWQCVLLGRHAVVVRMRKLQRLRTTRKRV